MFRILVSLILINFLKSFDLISQENLVINGSFEEIISCPTSASQINLAIPWISGTINGTPDLYNTCASDFSVSVPYHYPKNYQWPKTGNAYSGIFVFYSGIKNEHEFLKGQLKSTLKSKKYYTQFYISPRINNDIFINPCYIESIEISFTDYDSTYLFEDKRRFPLVPSIKNNSSIIKDSLNWTRVSGCIIGNNEKYLYLGNFKLNDLTLVDPICHKSFPNYAYYYIDDVGVFEFDPLPDTIYLCNGDIKQIGTRFLDGTYQWNTGARDSVITINKTGEYIVTVQMENCSLTDTVIVLDPEDILENKLMYFTICNDEKLTLEIPIVGTYKWTTGENSKTIDVKQSGKYTFEVTNDCGIFTSTYSVERQECNCQFLVPNTFSPNRDNINDHFELKANCNQPIKIIFFSVYNRWGELLYRIHDVDPSIVSWNGTCKEKKLPSGVYVWNVVYEYNIDSKVVRKNQFGDVTLVY